MWNPLQITKSTRIFSILALLAVFLLFYLVGISFRTNNLLVNKSQAIIPQSETLSQDEVVSIVRDLPEVRNFFKISNEATGSSTKYDPQIVIEKHEDGLWHLWVFENVRYDSGIGHATTFNRYIVDSTGKIKCSFAIYEGTKLVKVSSEKEYPCI